MASLLEPLQLAYQKFLSSSCWKAQLTTVHRRPPTSCLMPNRQFQAAEKVHVFQIESYLVDTVENAHNLQVDASCHGNLGQSGGVECAETYRRIFGIFRTDQDSIQEF